MTTAVRVDAILDGLTLSQAIELVEFLCAHPQPAPEHSPEKAREALVRRALSSHDYVLARRQRDLMRDPLRLDRQLLKDYVWYPWVRR